MNIRPPFGIGLLSLLLAESIFAGPDKSPAEPPVGPEQRISLWEVTVRPYGWLGWHLTARTTVELGYRYLYMDYTRGGFAYDLATHGAFVGMGFTF